jgi:hypothetical protein
MAAVPVTFDGMLYDLFNRTTQRVVFIGDVSLTGLSVGGGPLPGGPGVPIVPPGPGGMPIHPIWGPPGFNPPGPGMPPGIWGGPIIPDPPPPFPNPPPEGSKPPPASGWGWAYDPDIGWYLVWVPPVSGGKPNPPGGPGKK